MPTCKKCGRWGLFLDTDFWGVCDRCRAYERAQKEAELHARKQEIERKKAKQFRYFREKIFPTIASNADVQKIWSHWTPKIHDNEKQIGKQLKAIYEAIPISIDTKNLSGLFIDNIRFALFETSLLSCSCSDFKLGKWPCVHMYRLFHDLSEAERLNPQIFDIDSDLLSRFLMLDDDCKEDFISHIKYLPPEGTDRVIGKEISREINAGLLVKSDVYNYTPFLNNMTKDGIILMLAKKSIHDFRPSWSKVKLVAWVMENHLDIVSKHFKDYAHISLSQDVLSWGEGIRQSISSSTLSRPYSWRQAVDEATVDL